MNNKCTVSHVKQNSATPSVHLLFFSFLPLSCAPHQRCLQRWSSCYSSSEYLPLDPSTGPRLKTGFEMMEGLLSSDLGINQK